MSKAMMIIALCATALLSSCASEDTEEKYELKSPCVSAPSDDVAQTPCVRRPANADLLG